MRNNVIIHTDGGSRGNPGHAAYGYVFLDSTEQVVLEDGAYIGIATNNEAEYAGLLAAVNRLLEWDKLKSLEGATFRLDSNLVVQQVQGNWKIKEPRLRELVAQIHQRLHLLQIPYSIEYVPREKNWMADAMVNQKLDAQLG